MIIRDTISISDPGIFLFIVYHPSYLCVKFYCYIYLNKMKKQNLIILTILLDESGINIVILIYIILFIHYKK